MSFCYSGTDPRQDGAKGELLFKLAPMKGLKMFEELIVGNHPQGAVACARRMPDQYKDRFYRKMLGLLYRPDIKDKARILFFWETAVTGRLRI